MSSQSQRNDTKKEYASISDDVGYKKDSAGKNGSRSTERQYATIGNDVGYKKDSAGKGVLRKAKVEINSWLYLC
ncbi:hypothetical protein E2542_SST01809 [Spatholobus suberectus]|nr:hypothetical protein E2542_SST01809 [Spatholobus suberectus]